MGLRSRGDLTNRKSLRESLLQTPEEDEIHMDPNVWGPALWDLLFFICLRNPDKPKQMARIFTLLETILPCRDCRRSYVAYKNQFPFSEAADPAMWLWTIHDMVNQKLGKICISFEKLKRRYDVFSVTTHDLIVLDVYCIVAFASQKPSDVLEFMKCVSALLPAPFFKLPELIAKRVMLESNLLYELFDIAVQLHLHHGLPTTNRLAFETRYGRAQA